MQAATPSVNPPYFWLVWGALAVIGITAGAIRDQQFRALVFGAGRVGRVVVWRIVLSLITMFTVLTLLFAAVKFIKWAWSS